MIEYKETTVDHINQITPQAEQQIGFGIDDAVNLGVAETMFAHDEPIAAYGFVSMWEGVGTLWALLSDEATDTYPTALTRRCKEMLEEMIDGMELVRVQAEARCDHPEAVEWLEWMGFSIEARMEAYGPFDHADYYLMSRIIEPEVS